MVLEKAGFIMSLMHFYYLAIMGIALRLNKRESPFTSGSFVPKFSGNWLIDSGKSLNSAYFHCDYLISTIWESVALHMNEPDSLSPKDLLCQFGWNIYPCTSPGKEDANVFSFCSCYFLIENGGVLHLNKL